MGHRRYFKIDYLPELPDEAVEAFVAAAAGAGSPFTAFYVSPLGGAVARTDRRSMALEVPDAKWFYICQALWFDPSDADAEVAFAHAFMEAMRPWALDKALANFITADEGEQRLRASFGDDKYERLVEIKTSYDPDNVFALNPNIAPRAGR